MTKNARGNGSTGTTVECWHVTGRSPESIAIVACGPTLMDWHASQFAYDPVIKADEVWTLNKGIRTARADVAFVMDDLVGEGRRSALYRADILGCPCPIITSVLDDDVRQMYPGKTFVPYPIGHVFWSIGHARLRAAGVLKPDIEQVVAMGREASRYIQNSIPYMLAYAWFIGVRNVFLFGADYTFPGSPAREDDRANAEYWVGLVRGLGMCVQVPDTTTLLDTRYHKPMYGYGARQPVAPAPTEVDLARYQARYEQRCAAFAPAGADRLATDRNPRPRRSRKHAETERVVANVGADRSGNGGAA